LAWKHYFLDINGSIIGQVFSALHEKVLKKLNAYASPETRAAPGQPWVRGWDDKRGLGGPIAGNQ